MYVKVMMQTFAVAPFNGKYPTSYLMAIVMFKFFSQYSKIQSTNQEEMDDLITQSSCITCLQLLND